MTRDGLHYFTEPLPGARAQMRADLVVDGRVVLTYAIGSPAPRISVERALPRSSDDT